MNFAEFIDLCKMHTQNPCRKLGRGLLKKRNYEKVEVLLSVGNCLLCFLVKDMNLINIKSNLNLIARLSL